MTDFDDLDDVGTFEAPAPRLSFELQFETHVDTIDLQFVLMGANPCGEITVGAPRECLLGYV